MVKVDNKTYWRAAEVVRGGNVHKVHALFEENRDLLMALHPVNGTNWLYAAASEGALDLVHYLVDRGVPLNGADGSGNCPLSEMADRRDHETAKWMIEKGADPNISRMPMISAVSAGSLEIVKLFIEHGAEYNFVFGEPPRTPLSQAIDFGHEDVAAYLKSLGAIGVPESAAAPDESWMSEEEQHEEIIEYFTHHMGKKPKRLGVQEIVPGKVGISVWTIVGKANTVIFTSGMSTRPQHVPEGQEEYRYAELVMHLPKEWPTKPKLDSPQSWPWRWLRIMAHWPHEEETWLAGPFATFANGDPPEPLEAGCPFTAFLLSYDRSFPEFESEDGRLIKMITATPIYTEELRLAQEENGFVKLLLRFDEKKIGAELRMGRSNAGTSPVGSDC
jgi:hypothetical protein